ncbi:exosome complex RNA-binding protein Csl4 [Methanolapillus ohkumae]|uniref:Exosome complex component Csl4 n=1 Tax=Methanolapillus ohkumae TaxID=3028298 RepID=A0AA97A6M5_9EURY|nr:hypothetical protein MsAm2_12550 [Methanosarcinaceae archaeon Am2]
MSRVQKKPIRRKLKDVSSVADEAKDAQNAHISENDCACESPVRASPKSQIPRKPRPPIEKSSESVSDLESSCRPVRERSSERTNDRGGERYVEKSSERGGERMSERDGERGNRYDERNGGRSNSRYVERGTGERSSGERSSGERSSGERSSGERSRFGERSSDRNGERGGDKNRYGDRNGGKFGDRDNRGRNDRGGRGGRDGRDGKPREKKKRPEKVLFENTRQFTFPGAVIGTVEEYGPSFGAISDGGYIRATVSGFVGINNEKRLITVIPTTHTPNTISDGDIVIASVTDIRESSARVEIVAAEKNLDGEVVNNGTAEIYVSNIQDGFTKAVSDEFAVMDIVRAKVIDSSKIGLSTVGGEFGVVKAYCSKCKASLVRDENRLICAVCGNKEHRKLADTYGKGISGAPKKVLQK